MTAKRPTALSMLLFLLGACSANAPTSGAPPAAKLAGGASSLTAPGDLRGSVRRLTSRTASNVEFSDGRLAGVRLMRIQEGYAEVVLAKTNPDGTTSTRCVDSVEGAEAFLDNPSSPTRIKAAQ